MDLTHLERLLSELERSPGAIPRHRVQLEGYAAWCIDRILELSGRDADESQKQHIMRLQLRVRTLLAQADGAPEVERHIPSITSDPASGR